MTDPGSTSGGLVRPDDPARLPPLPAFPEFYRAINGRDPRAINGRDPFPWQARLADQVARGERWPAEIGVPTGLGKTACLDIAVWWLSSQADRAPRDRTAPTRIWWVVNRRLLVDSTAEHAAHIARRLRDPGSAGLDPSGRRAVECVAERLRSLWVDPDAPPLDVISLRGGIASRTPTDPARPTIILCTLPMYGSRLLFRGYGSNRRPVDAAMAGVDSLVLLDEAHLARHLRDLVPALADCHPKARGFPGADRSRPMVVALTATGDAPESERFDLDDDDRAHPVVRQRLDAAKPLRVVEVAKGNTAKPLAEAAVELIKEAPAPAACLVFNNTPKTARETFERLRKALPEAEILLLTGRVREREAARIRARILDPEDGMATARRADAARRRHLIVVATQTLEVGADIDAEYLVTEGCGVRALTQRLGRLNRLGRFPHARAIYVHVPPSKSRSGKGADADTWPVYDREPAKVLDRLLKMGAGGDDGTVALSPRSVASVLGPPGDDPGRAPEVLPGLLWEWTKTTMPPEGEAPVEPYFSGIAAPLLSVALLWRAHVPGQGRRLWPRATDREAVGVPLTEAREALETLADESMRRLAPDGVTVEEISAGLRPGDRIVVASDAGYMDEFGWNPAASGPAPDDSLARLGLPLDAVAIRRLCGAELGGLVDTALGVAGDDHDIDEEERTEAVSEILATLGGTPAPAGWEEKEWTEFIARLRPTVLEPRNEVPRLLVEQPDDEAKNDEFDELSLDPVAVDLDEHGQAVGTRARRLAERIGLPDDLLEVVERAAKLHDIGKADPRFQRWLDPRRGSGPLLAKSNEPRHRWEAMRVSSGWPKGGRHEELSARLVRAWLARAPDWGSPLQRDLLVHLVVSHHGKGRPLVPPAADDGTAGAVSGVVEGISVTADADLATIDWDQPSRFRRLQAQLGPWGLALLEAIVIRSDHAVSAGVDGTPDDV